MFRGSLLLITLFSSFVLNAADNFQIHYPRGVEELRDASFEFRNLLLDQFSESDDEVKIFSRGAWLRGHYNDLLYNFANINTAVIFHSPDVKKNKIEKVKDMLRENIIKSKGKIEVRSANLTDLQKMKKEEYKIGIRFFFYRD
jgi:hypothetical protein